MSAVARLKNFSEWSFSESKLLLKLPFESASEGTIKPNVPGVIFSTVKPTPMKTVSLLVAANSELLEDELDLNTNCLENQSFIDFVSGNYILPSSTPMSHRYGGFQFGVWADQLGDGRAHLLGEYINSSSKRWELQLKGSGLTPYSRFADGRSVLRSSIREFLCSEAMHYLGIPTSRAATITVSDDKVARDPDYSGCVQMEKTAVVLRMAESWFRFGSLEILAQRGEIDELRKLVDFIMETHYPSLTSYSAFFGQITQETAALISAWTSVGFVHGVMNTDNMSLLSITIDYGPFGFVEKYDPAFIPNTSDTNGRYDLQAQPAVALWNLQRLAVSITPLLNNDEDERKKMIDHLRCFAKMYETDITSRFRAKLGILQVDSSTKSDALVGLLLNMMTLQGSDFTQVFRDLSETSLLSLLEHKSSAIPNTAWGLKSIARDERFEEFIDLYVKQFGTNFDILNEERRREKMCAVNPAYVLRNWMAQSAIEKAENNSDFEGVKQLLRILKKPFKRQEEAEEAGFSKPPPSWASSLHVSCSS